MFGVVWRGVCAYVFVRAGVCVRVCIRVSVCARVCVEREGAYEFK